MIPLRLASLRAALVAVLAVCMTGCAASYEIIPPAPRPPAAPPPVAPSPEVSGGPLTLDDALVLALARSPALRAAAYEVRAREGEAHQAARPPNPEVEFGIEEFGGTGGRAGIGAAEIGGGLAQTLELGGDRRARAAVAAREAELGAWDYEAIRLDLVAEVRQAFAEVLAEEARLALAEEQRDLARRFAGAVTRRAEEGAVSPLEARRATVAAVTAETVLERTRRSAASARARLAATFGGDVGAVEVVGDLAALAPVPEMEALASLLDRSPEVARYGTALAQADARVRLERARRIPDPTIRAGGTYFNELGEAGVTAGFSIPLPLFDSNRGALRAAEARVAATAAEAESARLRARRELAASYGTLAASAEAARLLRDEALPAAHAAYEGILTGYREGRYDLLAVLDAQRALIETQNAYTDALADYHRARALVERLVAAPLDAASSRPGDLPDND